MATTHQVQRPETRDEALCRLADTAMERGIHILIEPISGEHFATSASDPTKLYRLTHYSCSCRGFMRWQRCGHHSALLAELGWLPLTPEPAPVPPAQTPEVPCHSCRGDGQVRAENFHGRIELMTCWSCAGAGVEPVTAAA
jgi:hypothetical protein